MPDGPAHDLLDLKFAALADPIRRAILVRLAQGEATVSDLCKPFPISQPAISRHLKVLEAAGFIECGQSAQSRPRRLNVEALRETTAWCEEIRSLWTDRFEAILRSVQQPK